jgi:hypothetical protein
LQGLSRAARFGYARRRQVRPQALGQTAREGRVTKPKLGAKLRPSAPFEAFVKDPAGMNAFCSHVIEGGSIASFCREKGINYTSLRGWLAADEARSAMYARAREDRSDTYAEEMVGISDEADVKITNGPDGEQRIALDAAAVARNRLRVDARKWVASKLKPRVYGDKLELGGEVKLTTVTDEALVAELTKLGIAITQITPRGEPDGD